MAAGVWEPVWTSTVPFSRLFPTPATNREKRPALRVDGLAAGVQEVLDVTGFDDNSSTLLRFRAKLILRRDLHQYPKSLQVLPLTPAKGNDTAIFEERAYHLPPPIPGSVPVFFLAGNPCSTTSFLSPQFTQRKVVRFSHEPSE